MSKVPLKPLNHRWIFFLLILSAFAMDTLVPINNHEVGLVLWIAVLFAALIAYIFTTKINRARISSGEVSQVVLALIPALLSPLVFYLDDRLSSLFVWIILWVYVPAYMLIFGRDTLKKEKILAFLFLAFIVLTFLSMKSFVEQLTTFWRLCLLALPVVSFCLLLYKVLGKTPSEGEHL